MILALNWITDRFCLQIRTRVSNQPTRHAVALESLCKLTAENMAGNNAYMCTSAQRWWVRMYPLIAAVVCSMNMDLLRRSLNKSKIFFWSRNWVKTLWNEMVAFVELKLRGSHADPAFHEIICSQITAVTLKWGVGGGGWPLTFFYGDHREDVSMRVMFQWTHAWSWALNWSPTVEFPVSGRFVLGKAFYDQAMEKVSPSHAALHKHRWQKHQRWCWLDVWFHLYARKDNRLAVTFRRLLFFLAGSLWFMLTDRIYVVTPSHDGWDEVDVEIIWFGIIAPNTSFRTRDSLIQIFHWFKKKGGKDFVWKLKWLSMEILSVRNADDILSKHGCNWSWWWWWMPERIKRMTAAFFFK